MNSVHPSVPLKHTQNVTNTATGTAFLLEFHYLITTDKHVCSYLCQISNECLSTAITAEAACYIIKVTL